MLKRFPVLPEERITEYTNKGYVLVFRLLRAENVEQPVDVITRHQLETESRWSGGDPITKVIPFNDGYDFLRKSDEQYLIRSNFGSELHSWSRFYNISDENDEEERKIYLRGIESY